MNLGFGSHGLIDRDEKQKSELLEPTQGGTLTEDPALHKAGSPVASPLG